MDNRWKLLEQYGELFCAKCHSSIVCDECGDMPEQCPVCGRKFDWSILYKLPTQRDKQLFSKIFAERIQVEEGDDEE